MVDKSRKQGLLELPKEEDENLRPIKINLKHCYKIKENSVVESFTEKVLRFVLNTKKKCDLVANNPESYQRLQDIADNLRHLYGDILEVNVTMLTNQRIVYKVAEINLLPEIQSTI